MGSEMCIRDSVPTGARKHIAEELHRAHSGLTKMMKTATQHYYWPNMRNILENVLTRCNECQEARAQQPRPTIEPAPPSQAAAPMNELGSDIYDALGKIWLVLADKYSGYVWNALIKDKCTATVVKQLTLWFNDCLLYTSPSPRDLSTSRMPSSA